MRVNKSIQYMTVITYNTYVYIFKIYKLTVNIIKKKMLKKSTKIIMEIFSTK
jgi:hypothetical protein